MLPHQRTHSDRGLRTDSVGLRFPSFTFIKVRNYPAKELIPSPALGVPCFHRVLPAKNKHIHHRRQQQQQHCLRNLEPSCASKRTSEHIFGSSHCQCGEPIQPSDLTGADTSALHEIWQRLQRSEEKTSEAKTVSPQVPGRFRLSRCRKPRYLVDQTILSKD